MVDDADVNADNNDAVQMKDNNADVMQCRRRITMQTTMLPPRRRVTTQTKNDAAADVKAVTKTMR